MVDFAKTTNLVLYILHNYLLLILSPPTVLVVGLSHLFFWTSFFFLFYNVFIMFLNNYVDKILDTTTHSFTLSHDVENRTSHKHYAGCCNIQMSYNYQLLYITHMHIFMYVLNASYHNQSSI